MPHSDEYCHLADLVRQGGLHDVLEGEDVVHMEIELDQEEEILLAASSISCT